MKKVLLLLASSIVASGSYAQIIVNPDGTHSVVHGDVIVNPDGTHSVRHGNVIVSPNGRHSTVHTLGKNRITINLNGPEKKFVINIDGSTITFDNKKSYKKILRLIRKEMRRVDRKTRRR
jgi:hypothetical protein